MFDHSSCMTAVAYNCLRLFVELWTRYEKQQMLNGDSSSMPSLRFVVGPPAKLVRLHPFHLYCLLWRHFSLKLKQKSNSRIRSDYGLIIFGQLELSPLRNDSVELDSDVELFRFELSELDE